jgi:hypothetical protein
MVKPADLASNPNQSTSVYIHNIKCDSDTFYILVCNSSMACTVPYDCRGSNIDASGNI